MCPTGTLPPSDVLIVERPAGRASAAAEGDAPEDGNNWDTARATVEVSPMLCGRTGLFSI